MAEAYKCDRCGEYYDAWSHDTRGCGGDEWTYMLSVPVIRRISRWDPWRGAEDSDLCRICYKVLLTELSKRI